MASYAALLSLFHTLNHITKHPRPPISLDQSQVDSLTQNLIFFQQFLERYPTYEDDNLERSIAAAAYAAEDLIESHIVDQIQAGSTSYGVDIPTVDFHGGMEGVIREMELIKGKVKEIIKMKPQHRHLHTISSIPTASTWKSSIEPVFDDVMTRHVLDKLTSEERGRTIISIVGMGGIGKTTFAQYIYSKPLIVEYFDICAWVTVSQEYNLLEILTQILCKENKESEISENELGERVHKMLWGRRYLIVMDDMWSTEAFYELRCFFPDNNNGSRIMITTRLSNLTSELSSSHVFGMKFLNEEESWVLLSKIVFGEQACPTTELEKIGKDIARNCRGLPLSILVIGGLLIQSNTRVHWGYILQNLNTLINSDNGENCLQILRLSYKELPINLKPCFLYLGIFREDRRIRVTKLIELWVAEGILRPSKDKSLEEVGEKYINDLIDRNLILVDKLRWNGKAKVCKIHDLLRDLCLREARKQRFFCVLKHQRYPNFLECMNMNMERRICIHDNTNEIYSSALEHASLTRSLISTIDWPELVQLLSSRLLRVYSGDNYINCNLSSVEAIFKNANLRLLSIALNLPQLSSFPSSWSNLWNLQTLKVDNQYSKPIKAPSEIWEMSLLRHVVINGVELPDPVCGENDPIVLEDFQKLLWVRNFRCSNVVIKRIPNVQTLKLTYHCDGGADDHNFGLNNIGHLTKLQSFNLFFYSPALLDRETYLMQNLSFPHSLKKLTLGGTMLKWKVFMMKIGSLPLLEYIRLGEIACCGEVWKTVEGQFCNLKFLQFECYELRYWMTEDTHFPRLEHLVLMHLPILEEIPSSIGDIPTLKSIRLVGCSRSAADSAKRIEEEQLDQGNTDFQLHDIGAGTGQMLIPSEALPFFKEIAHTFKYDREDYDKFIDVLNDYRLQRIDLNSVIRKVKKLFKGKPHVIFGFNKFLPEQYKITHAEEEEAP